MSWWKIQPNNHEVVVVLVTMLGKDSPTPGRSYLACFKSRRQRGLHSAAGALSRQQQTPAGTLPDGQAQGPLPIAVLRHGWKTCSLLLGTPLLRGSTAKSGSLLGIKTFPLFVFFVLIFSLTAVAVVVIADGGKYPRYTLTHWLPLARTYRLVLSFSGP